MSRYRYRRRTPAISTGIFVVACGAFVSLQRADAAIAPWKAVVVVAVLAAVLGFVWWYFVKRPL